MSYHLFSRQCVAARKQHTCIWCWTPIQSGDVYYREESVYDSRHQNHAWHIDCWFDSQVEYFRYGDAEFTSGNPRPQQFPFRSMEAA
jgi:hypothetical protein